MRSKLRGIFVLAVAVFAVSGVAAATASAAESHEYIVAGTPVGATTYTTSATLGATEMPFTFFSAKLNIKCSTGSYAGTLEKEGESKGEFKIEGCKLWEKPEKGEEFQLTGCKINGGLFTIPVKGVLTTFSGALANQFSSPNEKLITFAITGGECAYKKAYNWVEGTFTCAVSEAGTEKVEHSLGCTKEDEQLNSDGAEFHIIASVPVKLTGTAAGKKWKAR